MNQKDTQKPFGNFGQFLKLKQNGSLFRFGLSIGGWTFSAHFSEATRTSDVQFLMENNNTQKKYI